jgi:hypothetical protein
MAENESFFRKVVRFVANPTTEWTELSGRPGDGRELELEKSELKAMIERKRRNDFVRRREFDTLRRVRREGLSPEQLATLGSSSRLDDSEARSADLPSASPTGVKAKIDAIEQQMVGDTGFSAARAQARGQGAATQQTDLAAARPPAAASAYAPTQHSGLSPEPRASGRAELSLADSRGTDSRSSLAPLHVSRHPNGGSAQSGSVVGVRTSEASSFPPTAGPAAVQMGKGLPPLAPLSGVSFSGPGGSSSAASDTRRQPASSFTNPFEVEVSEVVHDPELDEAVIAFANADFGLCETALRRVTAATGPRAEHAETWLVLFDLYRATGQPDRFESLAMDYAQQFGWSAPQWYSLPQWVSETAAEEPLNTRHAALPAAEQASASDVGWICPEQLDVDGVARLRSQTLQLPLPWVLDWDGLRLVEPEAAMQLSTLLKLWGGQALEMRWLNGNRLMEVLQDSAPTGTRDADPVFWLARLEALRLTNRPDQFDEAAIDYCVTYEVSPPSWEAAKCNVVVTDDGHSTRGPSFSPVSDLSTSFMESSLVEDSSGVEIAHVELAGQLIGDISKTLDKILSESGKATVIQIACTRLIRVDFIAAGDLLNWVLSRRNEQRQVHFVEAHRLVALFFGAMGINEHAKVQVRKV